jgi:hypothetical protein
MVNEVLIFEGAMTISKQVEKLRLTDAANLPPEQGGPKGPEPTRFGDWEKKGLTSDF